MHFFVDVLTILQIYFQRIRKGKEKARADGDLEKQRIKRTPRKCFRYGSVDNIISKCAKPPKDN